MAKRSETVGAIPLASSRCGAERACGACQHIGEPYEAQLAAKTERIRALVEAAGFDATIVQPILGMDEPYHYRNKVISPFVAGRKLRAAGRGGARGEARDRASGGRGKRGAEKRDILTGMYAAGTHRVVDTSGCLIENEQAKQVIRAIRSIMLKHGMEPYDEDRGTGFVRHAIVRTGHESGEVLVTLVTNGQEFPSSRAFCRELRARCPFITTVVQNVNTRQTNVILGQEERTLYGPGFILDTLCGLSFRISSQSFYQVNATQTEVLYETAMQLAELGSARSIIDAYCGTGTIGLVAAKRSGTQVVGVDSVEAAIRDARENARHNGIENAEFVTADATAFLAQRAAEGASADIVFMDPPRAGSTPEFLDALAQLAPARVVYISCNPETQMRDLAHLAQHGYEPQVVQPVDMFPHTEHIECVCLVSREQSD